MFYINWSQVKHSVSLTVKPLITSAPKNKYFVTFAKDWIGHENDDKAFKEKASWRPDGIHHLSLSLSLYLSLSLSLSLSLWDLDCGRFATDRNILDE